MAHITFWIKAIVGLFNVRKSMQKFICNKLDQQFENINIHIRQCLKCERESICANCCKNFIGKACKGTPKIFNSWDIARAAMNIEKSDICSSANSTDVAGYLKTLQFCDFFEKSGDQKQHIEKVIEVRNQLAHSPTFTLGKHEMEIMLRKMIDLVKSFQNYDQDALKTLENLQTGLYGIKECLSGLKDAKAEIVDIVKEISVLKLASKMGKLQDNATEDKDKLANVLQNMFNTMDITNIKDAFENRIFHNLTVDDFEDEEHSGNLEDEQYYACDEYTEIVTSPKKFLKQADFNTCLFDCAYLLDGSLVVTDYSRDKLLLFNDSVILQAEYDVDSSPCGVCVSADGSLIYVVHYGGTFVTYRLQGGLRKVSCVKVQAGTTGVGVSGDIIITGHDDNITLYSMKGKNLSSISKNGLGTFICVSKDGSRFYHGDGNHIVCRTASNLSEVFRYSHPELFNPWGIACDRHGNILVTGRLCGNIIVIDKDGTQGRVLVDKLHGIRCPSGVCCHPKRDEFVVLSWQFGENAMQVYEIMYTAI